MADRGEANFRANEQGSAMPCIATVVSEHARAAARSDSLAGFIAQIGRLPCYELIFSDEIFIV